MFRIRMVSDFERSVFDPPLYSYLDCIFKPLIPFQQSYHCRSLLFSSQKFTANYLGDDQTEWFVDVYPKGVWFQRCLTVYRPPGLEVLLHLHVYFNPFPLCHAHFTNSLDQCVQLFSAVRHPLCRKDTEHLCYSFDLCYSKCWFSTDRIIQRSRV